MSMTVAEYLILQKRLIIKTENFKEADCFVLNTCHIREKATEKMFHEIGRIKKEYK